MYKKVGRGEGTRRVRHAIKIKVRVIEGPRNAALIINESWGDEGNGFLRTGGEGVRDGG